MSNEITLDADLTYSDSEGTAVSLGVIAKTVTVTTKIVSRLKQNIGITEEAIKLGEVSSIGYAIFVNRDTTNYVELKVAASGAIFAKMFPGEMAFLRLGSGAQVPVGIANTAPVQLDILLCSV